MILLALCLLGGLLGTFLPETLHQKLPDSMVEARLFGADQVFIFFGLESIGQKIALT